MENNLLSSQKLFFSNKLGILSTIFYEYTGFPFGSLVTYCVNYNGRPIIYISSIAEHTINLNKNKKCSLTIVKTNNKDIQASERLTLLCKSKKIGKNRLKKTSEKYFRIFPEALNYKNFHNFEIYELEIVKIRYIGGFGKIFWFNKNIFITKNAFDEEIEKSIIKHMNEDHLSSMIKYLKEYKSINVEKTDNVNMCNIDQFGFDLNYNNKLFRFSSEKKLLNSIDARNFMIKLLK